MSEKTGWSLHDEHMEMIDLVNNAKTEQEHRDSILRLQGWRDGVKACGRDIGWYLIQADLHQLQDRGVDRPMCCGVFNDWEQVATDGEIS